MIRHFALSMVFAILVGIGATRSLAQGGPSVVIAVSEQGRATVKIGEKAQTVSLPEAKAGDKAVCTVKDLVWFLCFLLAHDGMHRLHGRWFHLSREQFDALHYADMAMCKIGILLFNLVPYIALRIVG